MGDSLLAVRFPDGHLEWGRYQDTSDVAYRKLTTNREWWRAPDVAAPHVGQQPGCAERPPVDVVLATNYGGGFHWTGKAKAAGGELLECLSPVGRDGNAQPWARRPDEYHAGLPDWWPFLFVLLEYREHGVATVEGAYMTQEAAKAAHPGGQWVYGDEGVLTANDAEIVPTFCHR